MKTLRIDGIGIFEVHVLAFRQGAKLHLSVIAIQTGDGYRPRNFWISNSEVQSGNFRKMTTTLADWCKSTEDLARESMDWAIRRRLALGWDPLTAGSISRAYAILHFVRAMKAKHERDPTMSTVAYAYAVRTVERIEPDGQIVYYPETIGNVTDGIHRLEVLDFETLADPLANVRQAYAIAEAINNAPDEEDRTIEQWWNDNVDGNNDHHYNLIEEC